MKHTLLILFLAAMQSASAQTRSYHQTSDSTLLLLCGTANPNPGYYADEYGQIWDVYCWMQFGFERQDGTIEKSRCFGYCAKRVDLSPVRRLPVVPKLVVMQRKYIGA